MNVLTKYICSIGLLLLGSLSQLTAMNQLPVETSCGMQQSISENTSVFSIDLFSIDNKHNSSNSQSIIIEIEEEEEDKHAVRKKREQFYSFFLAYILSQETASSSLKDEITVHFSKKNTQTAASRCVTLQVFLI